MHLSLGFNYTLGECVSLTSFSPFKSISQLSNKYFIPNKRASSFSYTTRYSGPLSIPNWGASNALSMDSKRTTRFPMVDGHSTRAWNCLINFLSNGMGLSLLMILQTGLNKSFQSAQQSIRIGGWWRDLDNPVTASTMDCIFEYETVSLSENRPDFG